MPFAIPAWEGVSLQREVCSEESVNPWYGQQAGDTHPTGMHIFKYVLMSFPNVHNDSPVSFIVSPFDYIFHTSVPNTSSLCLFHAGKPHHGNLIKRVGQELLL